MNDALLVLSVLAAILLYIAYRQGKHMEGLREAKKMFINVLPLLLLAFIMVGFINALPKEVLQSGWEQDQAGRFSHRFINRCAHQGPSFSPCLTPFSATAFHRAAVAMITAWA